MGKRYECFTRKYLGGKQVPRREVWNVCCVIWELQVTKMQQLFTQWSSWHKDATTINRVEQLNSKCRLTVSQGMHRVCSQGVLTLWWWEYWMAYPFWRTVWSFPTKTILIIGKMDLERRASIWDFYILFVEFSISPWWCQNIFPLTKLFLKYKFSNNSPIKITSEGWRDGSAFKSTRCSFRRPEFNLQHPSQEAHYHW